jgi:hypothetical protein
MNASKMFFVCSVLACLCGCTAPCYERTVVKTYDGRGNLQSSVVTERVSQRDPYEHPLLDVLKDQAYQKQP